MKKEYLDWDLKGEKDSMREFKVKSSLFEDDIKKSWGIHTHTNLLVLINTFSKVDDQNQFTKQVGQFY